MSGEGYTPLHEACEFGDAEVVKKILGDKKKKQTWLNQADGRSCTPLLYAASTRNLSIIKLLLKAGAIPQITTKSNTSLFHFIARVKEPSALLHSVLKILAEKNVSVNAVNVNKISPLMEACLHGSLPCVKFFLEAGAEKHIAEVNRFGENALHAACRGGNLEIIRTLLEKGAPWNAVGNEGTPAQVAFKSFEVLEPSRVADIAKVFSEATGKAIMHTSFRSLSPSDVISHMARLFSRHFKCEREVETKLFQARKGTVRDICLWILIHCTRREAENVDLSAFLLLHSIYCTSDELSKVLILMSLEFKEMTSRYVNASGFALRLVHFATQWLVSPFTSDNAKVELTARMELQDAVARLVPDEQLFIMGATIPLDEPKPPLNRWESTQVGSFATDKNMLSTLDPTVIALHFTAIESKMCADIALKELIKNRWARRETAPYLFVLVDRTNLISGWVTTTVLSWGKDRSAAVKIFVKIAMHLHKIQNYNCCAAIVTGLTSLPLSRLKSLPHSLSSKTRSRLADLEAWYSPMSNYAAYRNLNKAPPAIPMLPVVFKDLTVIQETMRPYVDDENTVMNFRMVLQSERAVCGLYSHNTSYGIEEDATIREWLLNVKPPLTSGQLYELSLEVEPQRNTKTVEQQLKDARQALDLAREENVAMQKRLDSSLTVLLLLIQSEPDNRGLRAVKNALEGHFEEDVSKATIEDCDATPHVSVSLHRSLTCVSSASPSDAEQKESTPKAPECDIAPLEMLSSAPRSRRPSHSSRPSSIAFFGRKLSRAKSESGRMRQAAVEHRLVSPRQQKDDHNYQ